VLAGVSGDKSQVIGTLVYMSPERLKGYDAGAAETSLCLGAVLYEVVTGCNAFQRESLVETITAVD